MKIGDALKGFRRLYIETAPLIYYVEEHPVYVGKMDAIIAALEDSSIEVVSSVITLTEVLMQPIKVNNTKLEDEYRDILLNSGGFRLLPITASMAASAANLRARYNLRTPDALHIASAVEAGCDAFLTNDTGIKRVREMRILVLDDLESDMPET